MSTISAFKDPYDLCEKIYALFPDGEMLRDDNGQIVIYTGMMTDPDDKSKLIDFSTEKKV